MNKSIILDLVFDGRCYADKINMNNNKTYTKCYEKFEQKLKQLCEGMPKKKKDNFMWDITLLQAGIDSATSEEYFKEGFKLGMIIATQSFLD